MSATVDIRGPLFDGRAIKMTNDAKDDAVKSIATLGASMVRTNLDHVLKHQTPYYRIKVEAQPERPDWKITDQGVIYGPWLEGVSRRNRTTRFKGYATFRRTVQEINARAQNVAAEVVARYVGRMS